MARLRVSGTQTTAGHDPALGSGPVLEIDERADGRPIAELRDDEARIVRLARGVYAGVPTSEGRVRLLRLARSAATHRPRMSIRAGTMRTSIFARSKHAATRSATPAGWLPG